MSGKRGQGEGSIYKRDDGRWTATISLGYKDGKRVRKSFYGRTRREVQEQLTVALLNLQHGVVPVSDKRAVADCFPQWLEAKKPHVRPATYVAYEAHIRRHIVPKLGRIPLAKLTPPHPRELYAERRRAGWAQKTLHGLHLVVHGALKQAVRDEIIGRNVAELVAVSKGEKAEPATYTTEQARQFLRAIAGDRLEALYILAINTGLRLGELLALRWQDVDFENGVLNVNLTWSRDYHGRKMGRPKTQAGRRTVAIPPAAIASLRSHRTAQPEERLKTGPAWEDHDLLFPNTYGRPMNPNHVRDQALYPLLRRAGLPRIHPHGLR